ncbi:hypothetical protein E2C01_064561 [Portunus trituberculatus]|uniref:Uncharacterized protein n=1 Tax=Portunus trituberculatus TaxID=210409 RepID=A0A5B7HM60_PORTR|nr:hypothetical protein [Portunus trituberculatus]
MVSFCQTSLASQIINTVSDVIRNCLHQCSLLLAVQYKVELRHTLHLHAAFALISVSLAADVHYRGSQPLTSGLPQFFSSGFPRYPL